MITDRRLAGGAQALLALIARRLQEDIEYLQIREKDLEARELYELTRTVLTLPRKSTKIIVNSRLDVALAAGAHGVHLPSNSPQVDALRRICPQGFLLGTSSHTVADARATAGDYCLFAPVFAPLSKDDSRAPLGIAALRKAVESTRVPVFALGGVTAEQFDNIRATGAAGVAGISLFLH
jgi:thiamine-phosphate pyrophosphorylase